jgi:hypothetical protein
LGSNGKSVLCGEIIYESSGEKTARSVDMPGRCQEFTDMVYSGINSDPEKFWQNINAIQDKFNPPPMEYKLYCGEMHGHRNTSFISGPFYPGFFCVLILPKEPQAFTAQFPRNREQIENAEFSLNRC